MFLQRQGAEVFKTPPKLTDMLARASVVVSHAGAGLSQAALAVGRPQIVLPIHSESQMIARSLEKLGAAVSFEIEAELKVDRLAEAISTAAASSSMLAASQAQAAAIARLGLPAKPLTAAAELLYALLSRTGRASG
jgi:UDP:flavonoid glycosyltransferase YjiC (YdhE family)